MVVGIDVSHPGANDAAPSIAAMVVIYLEWVPLPLRGVFDGKPNYEKFRTLSYNSLLIYTTQGIVTPLTL